jgi:aminoglycoside phosphotransferase (APT) family kinase protein
MPDSPAAELDVTLDLVRNLLTDQHPDLADLPLTVVANGWDNVMLRLGQDLAVRMPRRALGATLMEHELDWLARLPSLPVAIPVPVRAGAPGRGYPWRWSVVPWFDGMALTGLQVAERGPLATAFAEFFAALHVPAPSDAPSSAVRGVPLATRDAPARARMARVPDAADLRDRWERALAVPAWAGSPVWIHGDPHPANVVVDRPGTPGGATPGPAVLRAVVDLGDLTSGDPASDLATAWLTFDPTDRAAFRARYDALTGRDPDTWRRAWGWALHLSLIFLTECDDMPELRDIGVHGLRQVRSEKGVGGAS